MEKALEFQAPPQHLRTEPQSVTPRDTAPNAPPRSLQAAPAGTRRDLCRDSSGGLCCDFCTFHGVPAPTRAREALCAPEGPALTSQTPPRETRLSSIRFESPHGSLRRAASQRVPSEIHLLRASQISSNYPRRIQELL